MYNVTLSINYLLQMSYGVIPITMRKSLRHSNLKIYIRGVI